MQSHVVCRRLKSPRRAARRPPLSKGVWYGAPFDKGGSERSERGICGRVLPPHGSHPAPGYLQTAE
jgi:hypothetical protein